jgi:hypothetical protein
VPQQTSRSKLCNALAFRKLASPRIQGLPRVERRRARVRARQADIRASEAVLNVGAFPQSSKESRCLLSGFEALRRSDYKLFNCSEPRHELE